jgi:hypothetical protein
MTKGIIEEANAVPKSDIAMISIPHNIAGLRALSANLPDTFENNNSASAGAEMTKPLAAPDNPISFPYNGMVGITAPTPMNRINCESIRRENGCHVDLGTVTPDISILSSIAMRGISWTVKNGYDSLEGFKNGCAGHDLNFVCLEETNASTETDQSKKSAEYLLQIKFVIRTF